MATRDQAEGKVDEVATALDRDDRWLLVQRIVESNGFERASQLRKILLYVARSTILSPDRVVREYDIACDVLDRRADFDPASDNIVRSQFSNLRRKLEAYFSDEGRAEPLVVKIPRGSYLPVFVPVRGRPQELLPDPPAPVNVNVAEVAEPAPALSERDISPRWSRKESILVALCLLPSLIMGLVLAFGRNSVQARRDLPGAGDNAFVRYMAQWEGDANVIVPDTSLVSLEVALNLGAVPLPDYASGQFPARQLSSVKDPAVRNTLAGVARMRNTTFNEAMIAADFVATMRRVGLRAKPRYARDLHVSDLNDGNTVVIGGASSDPWLSLFLDRMNFRHVEDPRADRYYFVNEKPAAGEQPLYPITYSRSGSIAEGYADVSLTQNPSHTGYVLLIDASDQQEAEAAANLLLHGKLPPEIDSLLARKNLHYFELLFRGRHIAGQADDSLELVAYRPNS